MNPSSSSPEFVAASRKFDDFISRYSQQNHDIRKTSLEFYAWHEQLVEAGWNRAALYRLVREALDKFLYTIEDKSDVSNNPAFDLLDNYEGWLIGDCASRIMQRLPGEPEGDFVNYVRSTQWMNDRGA